MAFSVTKFSPALVASFEPTPTGNLPLSAIDRSPGLRNLIDLLLVFEHGHEPAMAIWAALSKALVPYYPVAGRFVESDKGELEIACAGDGVWFVEASANCSLQDVNHFQLPLMIPKEELLPHPPAEIKQEDVIFTLQVTQFTGGGFVVGVRFNHALFDGIGVAQFLKAVADLAKGLPRPTVRPIWCREAIPDSLKLPQGAPPSFKPLGFEQCLLDISMDHINRVKNHFTEATGQRCSKFDVVTAMAWQCRTRAINLEPHVDVHLAFSVNTRHLLHQVLPRDGGYYGNCVYPMGITQPSGKIADASLAEIVRLIREAKEWLPVKVAKLVSGDATQGLSAVPIEYGSMCVSDWSRVGFYDLDFGWGAPAQVVPLVETDFVAWCFVLKPPAPKQGLRLLTRCVPKEHLTAFYDQMTSFW